MTKRPLLLTLSMSAALAGVIALPGIDGLIGAAHAAEQPTDGPIGEGISATGKDADPETREQIRFARDLSGAFQHAAERASRAVVHVTSRALTAQRARDAMGRIVRQEVLRDNGLGSGVIVSEDGYILTNHHVVAQADALLVRLNDGREFPATVVGSDEATDLAVLKVSETGLPYVSLADSDDLRVGEWVLAIGSPLGFDNTVTAGIVSAVGRRVNESNPSRYEEFVQTDAAINPGNSGGALVNLDGDVVGINSAIATRDGGNVGIGFAIPANMARAVFDAIKENGRVTRGYLGIVMAPMTPDRARQLGLTRSEGVEVGEVMAGSPADEGGLRTGDVIVAFDGRRIPDLNRLRNTIALTGPGETVSYTVVRDGEEVRGQVTLTDQRSFQRAQLLREPGVEYAKPAGLLLVTLTPALANELRYVEPVDGVLVLDVDPGSPGAKSGIARGDIVLRVGRRRVTSAGDMSSRLDAARIREGVAIEIIRGTARGTLQLQG